jgi:thiamine biosynthesis lipoprotein
VLAAVAAGAVAAPAGVEARSFRAEAVLGTSFALTAVGGETADAESARLAALAEIGRLDAVLSGWRADSELARLNASASHLASPDLFAVVASAEAWRQASEGAYDGRLGRVEALWRAGQAGGRRPGRDALDRALSGLATPELDARDGRIARPQGVEFALDGLAKGYVLDAALVAARRAAPALSGLMIDVGGDIVFWGRAPDAAGWRVAAFDPLAPEDNAAPAFSLSARAGAVASSGRGGRDWRIAGARYGTSLDPRTGAGCANLAATVFAPRAADADALATALMVLPPREGLAFAARHGAAAVVVDGEGASHAAPAWSSLAPPRLIRAAAPAAAAGPAWPTGFALTVDYEIPRIAGERAYPPYVSIWITDAANAPVRQLLLLGDDQNYIDQNYIWWRRVGRSAPTVVDAVARPTRPAGRYSAVWDGKDNAGRPVGQGRYTVHIEATREHGGHSYQTIPLQLGGVPVEGAAVAGDELGAGRARFGRR